MDAGINVSKTVVYEIVGPAPGVEVSKAVVYEIIGAWEGSNSDWWPFFIRYLREAE